MTRVRGVRARFRRIWPWLLAIPGAATAVSLAVEPLAAVQRMETVFYDLRLTTFSHPPARSTDIAIVAIDDATVHGIRENETYARNFGNWPYTRNLWTRVLAHLKAEGARAVVMDFAMDERSSDPGQDAALREEIASGRIPLYAGVAVNIPTERGVQLPRVTARNWTTGDLPALPTSARAAPADDPFGAAEDDLLPGPEEVARALAFPVRAEGFSLPDLAVTLPGLGRTMRHPVPPIPQLLGVTAGFGLVLPEADPDGKLRRTRFAYSDGANTYATLALATAADLLGADQVEIAPGRLRIGPRTLRIDPDGSAALDFGGALQERFDTRSLIAVLDDSVHRERGEPLGLRGFFRAKVVLIAGFAVGTYDSKATPFSNDTVGVVKPASELASMLDGGFITRAPRACTALLALGAALLSALLLLGTQNIWVETYWPLAAPVLLFFGTGPLLASGKLHLALVAPALAITLTNLTAVAVNHLFADRERARIKTMFSRYVATQVVEQLVEQPTLPKLDGETAEITAFFSDIRGFSGFSERFADDPQALVRLLNTYLTRVSGTLLRHGACLDKYIGDAVVCIFGAPLKLEDHAVRACAAALEAQAEIEVLRGELLSQGLPDVYTRIGINSARMFVGNFGSEQLFNYTAMGDGMNLASRLEGANKPYGSRILIGPRTQALAGEHFETRELDRVRVAGKTEAVSIHELLAPKGELAPVKREVVALYAEGLALWRAARFGEAERVFGRAVSLDPGDGPSQALRARCARDAVHPPSPFDGVINLDK